MTPVARWAYGQDFSSELMPLDSAWRVIWKRRLFAFAGLHLTRLAMNGAASGLCKNVMDSYFYLGEIGARPVKMEGSVAGFAPTSNGEGFTVVFMDGTSRDYTRDKLGRFSPGKVKRIRGLTGDHSSTEFPSARLAPAYAVYDGKNDCMYALTPKLDGIACLARDRWGGFRATHAPAVLSQLSYWSLSTVVRSKWLVETVSRTEARWYEKTPDGKLKYRFVAKVPSGERFLAVGQAPSD